MSEKIKVSNLRQKIVYVSVDVLRASEYNPRKHTEKQMQNLMESIRNYGLVDPIIVNNTPERKNIVIWGHFRLEAAKALAIKEVPVLYLSLSLEREKELNLRLNQNTWDWDFEILKDFDIWLLLDVGFDNAELSSMWDAMLWVEEDNFQIEKELEQLWDPQSKIGDIYALWNHRIMCWDSTNADQVTELIQSLPEGLWRVSMLYYDPPYNIGLSYSRWLNNSKQYGGEKTNDAKTWEAYREFLVTTLSNGLAHSHEDTHIFCWCDPNSIWLLQSIYSSLGLEPRRVCLWVKNNMNATPQVAFNRSYEPCVYATRWKPYLSPDLRNLTEVLDKEVWVWNRVLEDIIDLFDLWLAKRLVVGTYEHPTEKPPTLHEKPLKRCTKVGDIVLDLFGWSGSTLIACHQMKRTALLMEHEPLFIDLIIKRYEKLTGKKATKIKGA